MAKHLLNPLIVWKLCLYPRACSGWGQNSDPFVKGGFALLTYRKAPPSAHSAPKLIPLGLFLESESVTNTIPATLGWKRRTVVKSLACFSITTCGSRITRQSNGCFNPNRIAFWPLSLSKGQFYFQELLRGNFHLCVPPNLSGNESLVKTKDGVIKNGRQSWRHWESIVFSPTRSMSMLFNQKQGKTFAKEKSSVPRHQNVCCSFL